MWMINCLTIIKINRNLISFYLSKETLNKTNFKFVKIESTINIEKSLAYGNKISGHYVQGHTDTTGKVINIVILNKTWIVTFKIEKKFQKYLIEKGSIAINGISLTVANVAENSFSVSIVPHTFENTNLSILKINDSVNIEFDPLARYINKHYEK